MVGQAASKREMQLLQEFHNWRPIRWARNRLLRLTKLSFLPLALILSIALSACSPTADDGRLNSRTLAEANSFIDDTIRTEMILSPETATRFGLEAYAGPNATSRLSDHSQAGFERGRLLRVDLLAKLERRPRLPEAHPLGRDLDLTTEALARLVKLQQFGHGHLAWTETRPYAVDPFSGIWIEGPDLLINRHRIETLADAEAYIARLASLPGAIDDARRRLRADAGSSLVPPAAMLALMNTRLDALLSEPSPTLPLLISTLQNFVISVDGIDAQNRERLNRIAEETVNIELRRAYTELAQTVSEFVEIAPQHGGLWAQPDGFDVYLGFLDWQIGETVEPPEQLHAIHLAAVETERLAFQGLLSDLGLEGPLAEQLTALEELRSNPQAAQNVETASPVRQWPASLTAQPTLTQRRALDEHVAALYGISFKAASLDRSRPDLLVVNTRYMSLWPTWIGEILTTPATYRPQLELGIAMETAAGRSTTRRLTYLQAFDQGWAAYRTRHLFETEAPQGLSAVGAKHLFLIEAALAAADTGLHIERWSLSEAQTFLTENTGLSEPLIDKLILYIAANPGETTSRLIGLRRLENLRIRAEAVLGPRFEADDFHAVMLSDGSRPFALVEEDIERWYEAQLP